MPACLNPSLFIITFLFLTSEPLSSLDHLWIFIKFRIIPNFRITPKISISENKELRMVRILQPVELDLEDRTRTVFDDRTHTIYRLSDDFITVVTSKFSSIIAQCSALFV